MLARFDHETDHMPIGATEIYMRLQGHYMAILMLFGNNELG